MQLSRSPGERIRHRQMTPRVFRHEPPRRRTLMTWELARPARCTHTHARVSGTAALLPERSVTAAAAAGFVARSSSRRGRRARVYSITPGSDAPGPNRPHSGGGRTARDLARWLTRRARWGHEARTAPRNARESVGASWCRPGSPQRGGCAAQIHAGAHLCRRAIPRTNPRRARGRPPITRRGALRVRARLNDFRPPSGRTAASRSGGDIIG